MCEILSRRTADNNASIKCMQYRKQTCPAFNFVVEDVFLQITFTRTICDHRMLCKRNTLRFRVYNLSSNPLVSGLKDGIYFFFNVLEGDKRLYLSQLLRLIEDT